MRWKSPSPSSLDARVDRTHSPDYEWPKCDRRHLPGDYSLAKPLAAAAFSRQRWKDARPAGQVSDGTEALRYAGPREAPVRAARLGECDAAAGRAARARLCLR